MLPVIRSRRRNSFSQVVPDYINTAGKYLLNKAGEKALSYGKKKVQEYLNKPSKATPYQKMGNPTAQERGGSSAAKVSVKRKAKKGVRNKRSKKVKLPKGFKAKVMKSLESKSIFGKWEQVSYSAMDMIDFAVNGRQAVYCPGARNQSVDTSGGLANFFDNDAWGAVGNVSDYVHQISVLWNGKTGNQLVRNIYDTGTLSLPDSLNPTDFLTPTGAPAKPNGFQFTLKSHNESYRLKNNTQRTITIDIYLCRAKKVTTEGGNMVNTSGTTGVAIPFIGGPILSWSQGLNDQKLNGVWSAATPGVNNLFQKPTSVPLFNQNFKCELTTVILEPAQVYEYYINGPSNLNIDTAKCWSSNYFNDIQKWSLFPMFVCRLDMVGNKSVGGTKFPTRQATAQALGSVLVERRYVTKFQMPEQVGGPLFVPVLGGTGTGAVAQNQARRHRKAYTIYTEAVDVANLGVINDENPTVSIPT